MIKRICQIGIVLCFAVIISQFILVSYWKRDLASSYYYGLALSAFEGSDSVEVSDGSKIAILDGYRVGSWPGNGGYRWSLIHDELGNAEELNIHMNRFFAGPLAILTGLTNSIASKHCGLSGKLTRCVSDSGRYQYISEQIEKSDQSHACERVAGSMDPDAGGSFVEIIHIKVPGRPEVLSYSGPKGTAMSLLELIRHVLGELSSKPSAQFLAACLGQFEMELQESGNSTHLIPPMRPFQ